MTPERETELLAQISELTDRVVAASDARTDAEDLRRENAELRKILSEGATSEAAIATLREWTAGSRHTYEPGALMIAMPVSTACKIIDGIDRLEAEVAETRADRDTFQATLEQDAAERTRRKS